MNIKILCNLRLLLFLFCINQNSTKLFTQDVRGFRQYTTQLVKQIEESKYPESKGNRDLINQVVRGMDVIEDQNITIKIPVVFNILYSEEFTNFDLEKINSQFQITEQAFISDVSSKEFTEKIYAKTKFQELIYGLNLELCLASSNNEGETIESINSKFINENQWNEVNDIKSLEFGLAPIEPEHILNIWIADLGNENTGFAQLPGGDPSTDGIVIDYRWFDIDLNENNPYNKGYTFVHLLGSYLGLYELWNEETVCADDEVSDTPVHNAPNYSEIVYKHVSTCDNYPLEMYMNFMDNTNDEELFMFTKGQINRIIKILALDNGRKKIVTNNVSCQNSMNNPSLLTRNNKEIELDIFPNPATNKLNIKIQNLDIKSNSKIDFVDINGRVIKEIIVEKSTEEIIKIDVSKWVSGQYQLRLRSGEKCIIRKFMILN